MALLVVGGIFAKDLQNAPSNSYLAVGAGFCKKIENPHATTILDVRM